MVVSLSAVVLLGALVWGLWRYAGLRIWHIVVCTLFGFYLATSGAAPYIAGAAETVASFLAGLDI